jgi:hypothetical protein
MHEYSYVKIPQTVWAEICVLFRVSILASLVLALLLNTSAQFTLLHIICLVSTLQTYFSMFFSILIHGRAIQIYVEDLF